MGTSTDSSRRKKKSTKAQGKRRKSDKKLYNTWLVQGSIIGGGGKM